jgi:hypothetical protein
MNEVWAQRRRDVRDGEARFQPVILVIEGGQRMECRCGALATFIAVQLNEEGKIEAVCCQCHDCYCKEEEQ